MECGRGESEGEKWSVGEGVSPLYSTTNRNSPPYNFLQTSIPPPPLPQHTHTHTHTHTLTHTAPGCLHAAKLLAGFSQSLRLYPRSQGSSLEMLHTPAELASDSPGSVQYSTI